MKMQRYTLAEAQELARRDRRRLIMLGAGAVLVGAAYFLAPKLGGEDPGPVNQLGDGPPTVVELPLEPIPFEEESVLASIRDTTLEERLTVDTEAFVAVFRHARRQMPQHYEELGIRDLDVALRDSLLGSPATQRLAPLRVRGEVVDVERRRREGGTRDDWFVTLRGAEGVVAHGIVAGPPSLPGAERAEADAIRVGDHLRIDGLFFKVFRHEVAGAWLEGPLVLGDRALASMPLIDAGVAREARALDDVKDDEIGEVHDLDEEALWQLMGRAKLLAAETDWAAAREVDQTTLRLIYEDGDTFRGTAFRFPVSRNMGAWVETAPENPLGVPRVTKGWLGNVMWRSPVGVVQWVAPFERPELAFWDDVKKAKFVEARGWFFRNGVYSKRSGEPGRAPIFVLADVQPYIPKADGVTPIVLWVVLGLTLGVITLIFFLLRADKKKSAELQDALVRRRRARRDGGAVTGATTS